MHRSMEFNLNLVSTYVLQVICQDGKLAIGKNRPEHSNIKIRGDQFQSSCDLHAESAAMLIIFNRLQLLANLFCFNVTTNTVIKLSKFLHATYGARMVIAV